MFRLGAAHGAAALLLGKVVVVAGVEEEGVETCDAAGECSIDAGDDMSALQLRGQKQNYWDLIDAENVADILPYANSSSNMPECLQGIMYMDQQCTTWDQMSKQDVQKPCLGQAYPYMWVNEFLTATGEWDSWNKCFTAMRPAWTFGQADISSSVCAGKGIRACMKNAGTHGVCDPGARYCIPGKDWCFIKNKGEGWTRRTNYWWPMYTYYPVHIVVDGQGQKTKWFDDYTSEAIRTTCPKNAPYCGPRGCRKSQWAKNGQIANCLKETPGTYYYR